MVQVQTSLTLSKLGHDRFKPELKKIIFVYGVKLLSTIGPRSVFIIGVVEIGVLFWLFAKLRLNFFRASKYLRIFIVKNKKIEKHKAMYPILLIILFIDSVESDI